MNTKIITGTIIALILIVLVSFSTNASIFSTISMKGLSFASPQAAQLVQTVICVNDPVSCVEGYLTQQVSGQVLGELAKQSPEVAKSVEQYNQIKGWIDEGAKITEDLKLDDKGGIVGGVVETNDKERELGPLINPDNNDLSVKAKNIEVSTQGEGADVSFTAKKPGYVEINGKRYNLKENSKMIIDRNGNVKETDATFSEATSIELGGIKYDVPKNGRIVYKDGKAEIFTEPGETIKINDQEIKIGEGSITYDDKKITGKDFTIENTRFRGAEYGQLAEITLDKEGYILGRNTIAENNQIIITSEEGNLLLSKSCGSVAGFNNYVNPCMETLTMEGEGFLVQVKEGKHFGLDIGQGDILKYEFENGKVLLSNGEQTIYTREGQYVVITNGDIVTRYTTIDGIQQTLLDPESLGNKPDVDIITKVSNLATFEDSETGIETVYSCSETSTGSTYAVVDATGAFEKLPESVTSQQLPPQQMKPDCKLTIKIPPTDKEIRDKIKKYSSFQRFIFKKYPKEQQVRLIKASAPALDDKTIERTLEILNKEF